MKRIYNTKYAFVLAGAILGIIWFGLIWGFECLAITNVDWFKSGDSATHLFGWYYYKNSDWTFPLGLMEGITEPYKLSVIYTDSIPLFAIIFKLLSPLLPSCFQYFGIWGMACTMITGIIGSLLVYHLKGSFGCNLGVTTLLILQPCMLGRMFIHTALAGQWIILLALYIWINKEAFSTFKRRVLAWSVTMILATLIHMYFIPMVAVIMLGSMIEHAFSSDVNVKRLIREILIYLLPCLGGVISLFCMGALYGSVNVESDGLGYYCMNLNTLINPMGRSNILSELPVATDGQYEGFGYVGFGVLALVLSAFICIITSYINKQKKIEMPGRKRIISITMVVVIFIILGLGTLVSFNDISFFRWTYPEWIEKIIAVFRSSGRMVWPICFLIVIVAAYVIIKNSNKYMMTILCIACALLQLYDISSWVGAIHNDLDEQLSKEYVGLTDTIWDEIAKDDYEHILFLAEEVDKVAFADYATKNDITISDFWASRKDNWGIYEYRCKALENLKLGSIDEKTIYIFKENPKISENMYVYYADSYYIVTGRKIADYEQYKYKNFGLGMDFVLYLKEIKKLENCVVMIALQDEGSCGLTNEMVMAMNELGLMDFRGHFRESYIAVIDNQQVIEEDYSVDILEKVIEIDDKEFKISSAGGEASASSIAVDGNEYSLMGRGMNVVVYDKVTQQIIDQVTFDTYSDASSMRK